MLLGLIALAAAATGDMSAVDRARNAWFDCIDRAALKLSPLSKESAEAVGMAAVASCAKDERTFWDALVVAHGLDAIADAQWMLLLNRDRAREAAVAAVVIDRASK